ncbi:MAG TPA: class I SAM-dependent RNA methyltransferase [Sorangium sp.]|nr:class I SAM-dependent RNA methyltransferase [Sorangium sp.]
MGLDGQHRRVVIPSRPGAAAGAVCSDTVKPPRCPVQHHCGGCPLLPLPVDEQHRIKRARVEAAMRAAIGQMAALAPPRMVASYSEGYRRRLRMRVGADGWLGYFNEDKSPHCLVLHPSLREAMSRLRQVMHTLPRLSAATLYLEVRAPALCGRPAVYVKLRSEGAIKLLLPLRKLLPRWLLGCQFTAPMPYQRVELGNVYGYVPIDSFAQIHAETNGLLIAAVVSGARQRVRADSCDVGTFCDLYAGSGNFSLPLAGAGFTGHAVELQMGAVAALRRAAQEQSLALSVYAADARTSADEWGLPRRGFSLLVANPPRAGLRHGYRAVAAIAAEHVALVCCDAESIARDVANLFSRGYVLDQLICFDMFPHTQHVEVLAWLRRAAPYGRAPRGNGGC